MPGGGSGLGIVGGHEDAVALLQDSCRADQAAMRGVIHQAKGEHRDHEFDFIPHNNTPNSTSSIVLGRTISNDYASLLNDIKNKGLCLGWAGYFGQNVNNFDRFRRH